MRQRREMSVRKFERQHPELEVRRQTSDGSTFFCHISRKGTRDHYACGNGKTAEKAIYDASERCYRLAGLDAMEAQGWADANTGQTGIGLDVHHLQKRSAGRLDAQSNLVGVSRRTHQHQHEPQSSPGGGRRGTVVKAAG